jgi:crotonobetainyl-CoA:carnitine CoA-transferase CaiB-like acyl-CoA transferase
MADGTAGPLSDLRILDVSTLIPGPYATQMLADLGASVIAVEPPRGEPGRQMGADLHDVSHRNKRSICLDLKTDAGLRHCLDLASTADVVVEGFRPGVADRLGVGYHAVAARNPAIIYCSISGYGQEGPSSHFPGHDLNYLLASGFLSFPGTWRDRRGRRPGVPVADLGASGFATVAILAALHERAATGRGARLDAALTDAATALAAVRAGARLDIEGTAKAHLVPTNDIFETSDGSIGIGAVEDHFWQALRDVLAGFDDRIADVRFDTAAGRHEHGDELSCLVSSLLATRPTPYWSEVFAANDVPFAVLRSISDAVDDPQTKARGIVQELDGQRHVTFPVVKDGRPMGRLTRVAPAAGADTGTVLEALDAGHDPWATEWKKAVDE